VNDKQPTPGEWLMMGGGAVALLFSFFEFAGDTSAWGEFAFPIVTLIPLYAFVVGLLVVLVRYANVNLPNQILGFTLDQIYVALGFFATLMALFWLVAAEDTGIGAIFMLLGSAAVLAGAVMFQRERATGPRGTIG
jgi:hypothetical protein